MKITHNLHRLKAYPRLIRKQRMQHYLIHLLIAEAHFTLTVLPLKLEKNSSFADILSTAKLYLCHEIASPMASQIRRIKFIKNYPKQLIIKIIFLFIKGILILRFNLKGYFLIIVCFLFSLFMPSIKGCRPRLNMGFFKIYIDSFNLAKIPRCNFARQFGIVYRTGRMFDRHIISSYILYPLHTLYVWLLCSVCISCDFPFNKGAIYRAQKVHIIHWLGAKIHIALVAMIKRWKLHATITQNRWKSILIIAQPPKENYY